MKARIKSTGEIVEIKDLYDDGTALAGNMYIKVSELNFFSENIDWEQRRYELAKDIIKIVIANDYGVNSDVVAKYSLNCADALIKRLKENNGNFIESDGPITHLALVAANCPKCSYTSLFNLKTLGVL